MTEFEDICKDNYQSIYKYILGMTGNYDISNDLTQETFLIAYQNGKRFLKHKTPKAFLYKTAKNLVMAYFRRSKTEITLASEEFPEHLVADAFEQMCFKHENAIDAESYRKKILSQLSESDKQLYELYYEKNISMKIIAELLHMNSATLRMKYVRLRKRIKALVKELNLGDF